VGKRSGKSLLKYISGGAERKKKERGVKRDIAQMLWNVIFETPEKLEGEKLRETKHKPTTTTSIFEKSPAITLRSQQPVYRKREGGTQRKNRRGKRLSA